MAVAMGNAVAVGNDVAVGNGAGVSVALGGIGAVAAVLIWRISRRR